MPCLNGTLLRLGIYTEETKELIARIDGVQRSLNHQPRNHLIKTDRKFLKELDKVLEQEELFWFQKSRENWIVSGDRNTKFYLASALVRRSRNKIEALKDDNGNWVTETDQLKNKVQGFYTNMFQQYCNDRELALDKGCFPRLTEAKIQCPERSILPRRDKEGSF